MAAPAHAESPPAPAPNAAAAQALFEEGRRLTGVSKYAEACPKFEESQNLDPGIGTLFNLADCWEHIGRTASAWAAFLDVANQSKAAGQLEREQVARARRAALEPRLSRLTIVAPSDETPGLVVKRDGIEVPSSVWSLPVPVDLGPHEIVSTAPSRRTWEGTAAVKAEGSDVTIVIPPLAP